MPSAETDVRVAARSGPTVVHLRTLRQGWCGFISFFANVFVLANLVAWLQLRNLPQPRPAAGADDPTEQSGVTAA